jgi:hypothetical protein
MTLWRVDVCGVSHRFVEAETKADAEAQVVLALVEALDVRASDAGADLTRAYERAGPLQRKNMLARLDGLTNPRERLSSRTAKRRLERMVARDAEERAWIEGQVAQAPPMSPEAVDQVVRLLEIRHVEERLMRLPERDRHSPVHGERP